jgi:hypothetical protein
MAVTLIERARQVIATQDDDFFEAETILYYLNKAQRKVVSYCMQKEKANPRLSLRALDDLRVVGDSGTLSATAKGSYFQADITFPSGLLDFQHLRYENRTILRELNSQKLYMLEWGNLVPTIYEGYFQVTKVSADKKFRVFLHENPSGADRVHIFYVKAPTDITLTSTSLTELPEQLENAVIYGAAMMMTAQESVKDPNPSGQGIATIYQEELQASVY